MESKYIRVKETKVDEKLDFYTSFGWVLEGEPEQLGKGKVGLTLTRDKKVLEESYATVVKGERIYNSIARPYPLAAIIAFAIGCTLLVLYFVMKPVLEFYISFLFASLGFFCASIYLGVIFLIIFLKRKSLLKKVVNNVGIEAGTIRELPLKNNIKPENNDTWLIANNI